VPQPAVSAHNAQRSRRYCLPVGPNLRVAFSQTVAETVVVESLLHDA
jgi:hypothetical protein